MQVHYFYIVLNKMADLCNVYVFSSRVRSKNLGKYHHVPTDEESGSVSHGRRSSVSINGTTCEVDSEGELDRYGNNEKMSLDA